MSKGTPTLDEAIRAYPAILETLARIEAQNAELIALIRGSHGAPLQANYDVSALKARGYGQREAYRILRTYGAKKKGRRWRVTLDELMRYESELSESG